MFSQKEKPKYQRELERELENMITWMRSTTHDTEDYAKALAKVERLHSMMEKDKTSDVSKETLVIVGANLLGILLIIKHEAVNVITSKALNFVIRPRI